MRESPPRILFGVSPVQGHVNPTIAIAQRLQESGHAVAYACHPEMADTLTRAGLELLDGYRWGDLMVRVQRDMGTRENRWIALVRGARGSPTGIYFDDLERGVDDLVRALRTWRADVLVTDLLFPPGAIAAEACRLPYATFCPVVLPLPSAVLPPYGFGLSPRARRDWRWLLASVVLHRLVRSGDRPVNRVRRRHGLEVLRGTFFHVSPYLVLAFTTEAFEYPRPDLPPQVYFVGPSIAERRGDTDVPFPWTWLDGRPVVYTSLGTINTGQARFFDKAIEASYGQPWQMVVSAGRHSDLGRWGGAPDNVLVRGYVPQPEVLRRATAVMTHGGSNTVNEALAMGLPLAVAPAGADQPEAAQRVVEAGVGLRLKLRTVTPGELREAIRRLIEDPSLRANAERIARDFARCDGPAVSAALIERLARTRVPLRRPGSRRPTVYGDEIGEFL